MFQGNMKDGHLNESGEKYTSRFGENLARVKFKKFKITTIHYYYY